MSWTPRTLALLVALMTLMALVVAATVTARPQTTDTQTILDRDRDNQLEPAPGEPHLFRDDLGATDPEIERNPLTLATFGQLTDFHVIDEESPLRVEWLDEFDRPFTSAYRPQEGLMPQVVNEMIEQIRNTVSPVTHDRIELAMTTGDNTDNTQCNETRWMIDLMDGKLFIDPNSGIEGGIPEPEFQDICNTPVTDPDSGQTHDPNETFPPAASPPPDPACQAIPDNGSIYDGVKGQKQYYDPDQSSPPPDDPDEENLDSPDGRGYSPHPQENLVEEGRNSEVRDFPGLFESMNRPFRATGLQGLPWYGIFGNHDGLIQGNQPRNPLFEAYATGCLKVNAPSAALRNTLESAPSQPSPEGLRQLMEAVLNDVLASAEADNGTIVPPDPRRRPLRKSEYIAEHFATSGVPVGHGFGPENVASGMGYYSFYPREHLKFIVLDSISETGGDGGNIDHPQFQWLDGELADAEANDDLVMVFAHHSLRTMNQPEPAPPFTPGDQGGQSTPPLHFGMKPNDQDGPTPTPCEADPQPETLRCLLLRHPGVIALVNGHEHENRITAWARHDQDPRPGEQRDQAEGGFWEINTASHIDWPQQSRLLDLVDNGDGTLSIFTTIVDHAGAPMPGGAPPSDGQGGTGPAPNRLASIARELSFNDPDSRNGEDDEPNQRGDARGNPEDRNTELVVRNPYGQ